MACEWVAQMSHQHALILEKHTEMAAAYSELPIFATEQRVHHWWTQLYEVWKGSTAETPLAFSGNSHETVLSGPA